MSPRLDKEMVTRALAPSRTRAAQLISSGEVSVAGDSAVKPSTRVSPSTPITVTAGQQWVSRAAHKLLGALEAFPAVQPRGARCLDAGASTGGFTQVLLSRGAAHVVAADVGHQQLAQQLRDHPQVTTYEGTNLRYVAPGGFGEAFDLIVVDLSFISLRLVIEPLAQLAAAHADLLVMVKPQFEIGRQHLPRSGVVTSPAHRRQAVEGVIEAADQAGLSAAGIARSLLPGQDGNAEFFLHLYRETSGVSAAGDRVGRAKAHIDLDTIDFSDQPGEREVR